MKNCYISAKLVSFNQIRVFELSFLPFKENIVFFLKKDDEKAKILKLIKHISNNSLSIYELELDEDFIFGSHYELYTDNFAHISLDVSDIPLLENFDEKFYYDGDDLGAIYSKNKTDFALWAPISEKVFLKLENTDGDFDLFAMARHDNGVYKLSIYDNLLNRKYRFLIYNYDGSVEINDPYGKGTSLNSIYSCVVDIESIKNIKTIKPTYTLNNLNEHIIYELNIRDFSENKFTDIVNKGKYLGLIEENRKTNNGYPAGLDYLKFINVTTIQLQPILDFRGVDDIDVLKSYNWGYDPISMFAIEGSYSIHPEIPQSRLKEFKEMVNGLHKNNLYVTVDVVYNHVYDYLSLCYEKIVPNYFFRRKENGELSSSSGCGNDFASERRMARKAIIDSLFYLTDTFDVDGFRFDLMGLIDIKSIKDAYTKCKKIKSNIIFYGEGWDMGYELKKDEKAAIINCDQMVDFAFFDDSFRNILKGSTSDYDLDVKGFLGGDLNYTDGAIYALLGASCDYCFKRRFIFPHQSLNYVECHDNHTLFDKLMISNHEDSLDTILERIKFTNTLINVSLGVPFFHMGQEIGLSKCGLGNTYNIPFINSMDYDLVEKRFKMVNYFKTINTLRRETPFLKFDDANAFLHIFEIIKKDNGLICFNKKENVHFYDFKKLIIIINPTNSLQVYDLNDYFKAYFYNGGFIKNDNDNYVKTAILSPLSVSIFYLK